MTLVLHYSEPTPLIDVSFGGIREAIFAPRRGRAALVEPAQVEEPWRAAVDVRFAKLSTYEAGWDGYQGEPPRRTVIAFARSILNSVMRPTTPTPAIVPMVGGGLQLEWHVGGLDIELAIYRPREAELSVAFADGRASIEDEPLSSSFDALSTVLEELA